MELMSLAVCRAAHEGDLLVDDIDLRQLSAWLDGENPERLLMGSVDAWGEERPWRRWAHDDRLLRRTRDVVAHAIALAQAESAKTLTSTVGALLLGARVRAVRAHGIPDLGPEWADEIRCAGDDVDRLTLAVRSDLWRPTPTHRAYARDLSRTLTATPDYPPRPPEATTATWIQRVLHFSHIRDTTLALAALPRYAPISLASDPLGLAVGGVVHSGAHSVTEFSAELDRLWAARPPGQTLTEWEADHLPCPVREQVEAAERLVVDLAGILQELTRT
ncbi:hypothetical protein [Streptomyces californicus]|uniref:hypothetical protein n=1 Tax=Streptomyces californicus TaxID=67351 RepID=UPI0037BA6119